MDHNYERDNGGFLVNIADHLEMFQFKTASIMQFNNYDQFTYEIDLNITLSD